MLETILNMAGTLGADTSQRSTNWWDQLWWLGRTGDSTFANSVDMIFFYIFWVSVLFFVVLMALMLIWTVKYKRVPGKHAQPSPAHHTGLEITWTVIPTILLAVMFFWGFYDYVKFTVAPIDSEQVHVTAQQWAWNWEYDNGANSIMEPEIIADKPSPVFALPANRPTKFTMSSADVIHSMYFPAFRAKRDVFPNRYTIMWVEPTRATHKAVEQDDGKVTFERLDPDDPGFYMSCTEYCGDQHSQMWARIITLDPADFIRWKEEQANTAGIPLLELGEKLWVSKGCVACHTTDGGTGTGPTWKGAWGTVRVFDDGTSTQMDENYIRESILEPAKNIVEGYPNQMVSYQGRLTDREIRAITVYIRSLSDSQQDKDAAKSESDAEKAAQEEGAEAPAEGGEG